MKQQKNGNDIVFVILHYLTYIDTIDCIVSIKENCKAKDYKIVIVDNHSNNNSIERLYEKFDNDPEIIILENESNLGFAKANNAGIGYAVDNLNPQFVAVINNDTILLQKDTIDLIFSEYETSSFGVLGPMIYTADGHCDDNPNRGEVRNKSEVKKLIRTYEQHLILYKCYLWGPYRFLMVLKEKLKGNKITQKSYLKRATNVQLHGCFLVFSTKFFEKLDGFYAGTFLYMEEDILFYQCLKNDILTVYNPEIKIFHKEDSASQIEWKNKKKREFNKKKYMLDSAKKLLNLMDSDTEESASINGK